MADAFEPRFVDLVRNHTMTQGTGNFVLGSAVEGYRSFGSAIQPGESFYYSALAVENPSEFEVGRGTMQADGTISRTPISGTLTSFSAGNKTVALVAAAEWHELIQAGADAAVVTVESRGELAALADLSKPALLTERGREGLFVFDASDLSAKIASDAAQAVYAAPASDPTGASGAWVRKFSGPLEARWFGAVGDGIADDSAAIQSALDYLQAAGGGVLRLGGGTFTITGTLLLFASDVTVDAKGATITSSDEWSIPGLYLGGDRARIVGGTWKLTGGNHGPRWFDIEGRNCEIDGARIVKEPEETGVQGYVRSSADGFTMRNCRLEGGDGIQHEASNSAFLYNDFNALQVGGDDCVAIKAIQATVENVRFIGNRCRLFSNLVAIGSNIGTVGVDDPTFSKRVRNVVIVGNTGEECASLALIKPGAVNGKDYRNGMVEGVTI